MHHPMGRALCLVFGLIGWSVAVHAEPALPDGLYAEFATPRGTITCELFYREAPLPVANFTGLAEGKLGPNPGTPYFDGQVLHRVVPGFVVQGGDPTGTGEGDPGYEFPDAFVPGLRHDAVGILSMANAGPDTNGSQFFLTLRPVNRLNYLHSVFGKIVRGGDVLSRLERGDALSSVRILRIGAEAVAFRNDPEAFAALVAAAPRYSGTTEPGPDAAFADPDGLLPADVPRAVYFNYQLHNFARATGLRIALRVAATYTPDPPSQRPGAQARALADHLGLVHSGVAAVWFADTGQWGLWVGDRELPRLVGRPGTAHDFMQAKALHPAKQALIARADALAEELIAGDSARAAAEGRAFSEPERLTARLDAMIETLFTTLEPRP